MSSAQGFKKALSPWRDPLKKIKGKKCAMLGCDESATCAVLSLKIGPACEAHGKRAQELGYQVIFPGDGTLTIKKGSQ